MNPTISHDIKHLTEEEEHETREIMRQGYKDAMEELFSEWEFEPTLHDFANRFPPMRKEVNGITLYRYFMDYEEKKVLHTGQTIRFPVRWTMDGPEYEIRGIPEKKWKAGERWTQMKFWDTACAVYSKNKMRAVKEMGDHIFFEGIDDDGTIDTGS